MTSDWIAAVAPLLNVPMPRLASTTGAAPSNWITSAAVATVVSILVAGLVTTLLARRREKFDRSEKEKERAHDRQKEIGEAASAYLAAVHAFRAAAIQFAERQFRHDWTGERGVRERFDAIGLTSDRVHLATEPTPNGRAQIDASVEVELECCKLMDSLAPTTQDDAWKAARDALSDALHVFTSRTIHLKWEIAGHEPRYEGPPD
ncbi:hypothetical protein [Streptomyces lunaelactis]|uniref:hypothetical protein n=1 Tax=Streptomyces lunaelactis TaxID=1535768 RepID=UPI00158597B2|nr:hypothetical protein [Streptomyces lunaelactis]NUK05663.1 hypothetical protein [Streptomyces lunaelactis]NUK20081.1 hypothetical protein [Streptomyces lunaelactis]